MGEQETDSHLRDLPLSRARLSSKKEEVTYPTSGM